MTIDAWLSAATSDAERRGLTELKPLLESLARAIQALRAADFNDDASQPSAAPGKTTIDRRQSQGEDPRR